MQGVLFFIQREGGGGGQTYPENLDKQQPLYRKRFIKTDIGKY